MKRYPPEDYSLSVFKVVKAETTISHLPMLSEQQRFFSIVTSSNYAVEYFVGEPARLRKGRLPYSNDTDFGGPLMAFYTVDAARYAYRLFDWHGEIWKARAVPYRMTPIGIMGPGWYNMGISKFWEIMEAGLMTQDFLEEHPGLIELPPPGTIFCEQIILVSRV